MKFYIYKIQWIDKPKNAMKLIDILGARSLTYISFMDMNLNRIEKYNSIQNVPVSKGLSLETLKNFCEQTTKEIAAENKGEFVGIEYEEPIEENEF